MSLAGSKREAGVTLLEMLIVVAIIGVIAGISFPAMSAGLAGVRLASAAGSAASFLTSAMNTVERREKPAEIVIQPKENRIAVFTAAAGDRPIDTLSMPAGISVEGEESHRFLLFPGGAFPHISLVLRSDKGGRRSIDIDPVTAVPKIARLGADAK
jgi:prepilin-type N-terminal cleavage/methylation domain-containing protein